MEFGMVRTHVCVCAWARPSFRACVCITMRACMRAYVHACICPTAGGSSTAAGDRSSKGVRLPGPYHHPQLSEMRTESEVGVC